MSYCDANPPVSKRVADLLDLMTLDEKLAQLYSYWMRNLLEDSQSLCTGKVEQLLAFGIG
jgi:beta-glucosidase